MPLRRSPRLRAAWPEWAAHSVALSRRGGAQLRQRRPQKEAEFAELISKETGKPFGKRGRKSARSSTRSRSPIDAYAERTPQRKLEAATGQQGRGPPQAARGARGARPVQFPRSPAERAYRPGADRGQRGRLQAVREDAGGRRVPRPLLPRSQDSRRRRPAAHRRAGPGPRARAEPGIDGLLFTGSARAGQSLHRQFAETPHKILALELGGNNPLVVWHAKDIEAAAAIVVQSAYLTRRTAMHRRAAADRGGRSRTASCSPRSRSCSTG